MSWNGEKSLRAGLSFAILFLLALLTAGVISGAGLVKGYETDLAEINDIKYGLLDADNWVEQISAILERRIDQFELNDRNKPAIKRNIERVLDRLLVEIDAYQRRQNERGGNWLDRVRGSIRQEVRDLFLDLDDLRQKVPFYAEKILEEISKPDAKRDLEDQFKAALAGLAESTFAKTDRTGFDAVLGNHGCVHAAACKSLLEARIVQTRQAVIHKALAVIGLAALLFMVCLFRSPALSQQQMLVLILATLILLAGGLMTPMIGIEAEISSLRLQLMGEPLVFENQVLYFQSKSVVDLVWVLLETGKPDMLLVGFLIALFSVVFPLGKVVASYLYFHDLKGLRGSPTVRFFALESGKWSMADVFVIAMFMAFVGLQGLVSNQLATLAGSGKTVEVLTTNGTLLQVGFYLFLSFTMASLLVSTVLDDRLRERHVT